MLYKIKLTARYEVALQTIKIVFEKPEGFTFKPGQYAGITLINPPETDAGGVTRRFSILSAPDDPLLAIVTRVQSSAFKRVLSQLPIGSEVKFAGPTGAFTLHDDLSIPAVLIAGGIGIAPFFSMIKHATKRKLTQPLYLFYGNQTRQHTAFLDELLDMQHHHSCFKLIAAMDKPDPTWQGETGYITSTLIKKYIPDLSLPIYYVCGSPVMVTTLQETLVEMGITEEKICVEDFPGY